MSETLKPLTDAEVDDFLRSLFIEGLKPEKEPSRAFIVGEMLRLCAQAKLANRPADKPQWSPIADFEKMRKLEMSYLVEQAKGRGCNAQAAQAGIKFLDMAAESLGILPKPPKAL